MKLFKSWLTMVVTTAALIVYLQYVHHWTGIAIGAACSTCWLLGMETK